MHSERHRHIQRRQSPVQPQTAPRPVIIATIRFNPCMRWWQASLMERLPEGAIRPYRAATANVVAATTHAECLSRTKSLLETLGVSWEIAEIGELLLSTPTPDK